MTSKSVFRAAIAALLISLGTSVAPGAAQSSTQYLYWVEGGDAIGRVDTSGGAANKSFIPGIGSGCGITMDGSRLYWTGNTTISRANLDGSGVQSNFITGLTNPCGIAVDGAHVYWCRTTTTGGIGRANLDGSGMNEDFIATDRYPCGVAVDGAHVYWAVRDKGYIGRANLDGSSVEPIFIDTGKSGVCGVAVNAGSIYWTTGGSGGSVGRAAIDGTNVDADFIAGLDHPNGVTIDAAHIYWGVAADGLISRANLDGSSVNVNFITGLSGPYWVTSSPSAPEPPAGSGTKVYTANFDDSNVSVLRQSDLTRVVPDVDAGDPPQAIAVSTDGLRVYTGNGGTGHGSITVIDGTTNTFVQKVDVSASADVSDIAVSADGAKVCAGLQPTSLAVAGSVVVMDTTTFALSTPFPVPATSGTPLPVAIDFSADGESIFVLTTEPRVVKMSATDGSAQGGVGVPSGAAELKVSADGLTVVVVGYHPARFFSTADLTPVPGASVVTYGNQADVATALGNAYVLDLAHVGPGGDDDPTIDVFEAATGKYLKAISLGSGVQPLGITVLSDGSTAFVSYLGNLGLGYARSVDLNTGALGPVGPTGAHPRRIAVNELGATERISSFFLPRTLTLSIDKKGSSAKDTLIGSGYYDDGGGAGVDYVSQPVTIEIGGYSRTIQLVPNKKGTIFTFNDATLNFVLTPRVRKASLGFYTIKIAKTPLGALIDPAQPLTFHFHAAGIVDAPGEVLLTKSKYKRGSRRGDVLVPHVFPAHVIVKLGGQNKDSLVLRAGFASGGTAPAALGTVRVAFGRQFARTVAGGLFKKSKNADAWTYVSKVGKAKVSITVDFSKDFVSINATNVELGPLSDETTDFVFDAGDGKGAFRNTIHLSADSKGKARTY